MKSRVIPIFAVVAISLGLATSKATADTMPPPDGFNPPGTLMTTAALEAIYFSGSHFYISTEDPEGKPIYNTLHDGKGAAFLKLNGVPGTLFGDYHVGNDQICFRWLLIHKPEDPASCFWTYQVGDGKYRVFSSKYEDIGTGTYKPAKFMDNKDR